MDFPSLIRLGSWFVPIPFMLLYHINTVKLERYVKIIPLSTFVLSAVLILLNFSAGFRTELYIFYLIIIGLSFHVFSHKYSFFQSISIAVCLTFFASFYWEIPYHIFSVVYKGYLDQATPLHLLYVFPLLFVSQKIKLRLDELDVGLIGMSLGFSTLTMILLISSGADFYLIEVQAGAFPHNMWLVTEGVWFITRAVCFTVLYIIFYRGSSRHNPYCKLGGVCEET